MCRAMDIRPASPSRASQYNRSRPSVPCAITSLLGGMRARYYSGASGTTTIRITTMYYAHSMHSAYACSKTLTSACPPCASLPGNLRNSSKPFLIFVALRSLAEPSPFLDSSRIASGISQLELVSIRWSICSIVMQLEMYSVRSKRAVSMSNES